MTIEACLCFDTTGSMYPYLNETRSGLRQVVAGLQETCICLRPCQFGFRRGRQPAELMARWTARPPACLTDRPPARPAARLTACLDGVP